MAAKYIIPSLLGSVAIAFACDNLIADQKIFGGTTPSTVSNKEWWKETDKNFFGHEPHQPPKFHCQVQP